MIAGLGPLAAGFMVCVALYIAVIVAKPDAFFADDSYFYFQVAWNFARGMGSTFNNMMNTNGYHPLWMLICALVFKVLPVKTAAVHGIAAVLCLCDVLTLYLVRRTLAQQGENTWWIAFALLVPFSFLSQLGTEGALSGCLLAAVAYSVYGFATQPTSRRAMLFSIVAALAVLARLDNIFIVSFVWLAVGLVGSAPTRKRVLRLQLSCIPVYVVLWGSYLASNKFYFGIFEPISGMVKSHPGAHPKLGSNLPHTALLALGFILPSIILLAWKKRDTFFRTVELPFTLGVLCHAWYILFRMSDETRWSWYYTSWILLAAFVLARVSSLILRALDRPTARLALSTLLAWGCLMVVLVGWVKVSRPQIYRSSSSERPLFFEQIAQNAHIHTAFSFDKPGRIAYYSSIRVIPLDNLMGNIEFQRELLADGVNGYASAKGVDTFIGPPVPLDKGGYRQFCDRMNLDSFLFRCVQSGAEAWMPIRVDVYSRIPHAYVGTLQLSQKQLLWTKPGEVSLWRIVPSSTGGGN